MPSIFTRATDTLDRLDQDEIVLLGRATPYTDRHLARRLGEPEAGSVAAV